MVDSSSRPAAAAICRPTRPPADGDGLKVGGNKHQRQSSDALKQCRGAMLGLLSSQLVVNSSRLRFSLQLIAPHAHSPAELRLPLPLRGCLFCVETELAAARKTEMTE